MKDIVVIGGGIAGLGAALALTKAGFPVAVYEAHPDSGADIGAFLTLASNGMLALGQLDAAEAVARAGFPLTALRVIDDTGATLTTAPLGTADEPLTWYRCLRRAELCAVLHGEVLRRGIAVHHGKRLTAVTEGATAVTARFADGTAATGAVLIGADGLNSAVRPLVEPAAPRYAGQQIFYGYATGVAPPTAPERFEMVRGSTAAFGYAVSPAGETSWFARVSGPELTAEEIATTPPDRLRTRLLALLRPDRTPAADIVAATGAAILATNAHDLPSVTRWYTGRILLVGDAAHAASPATGQGASMALEDAVVLAKALRDNGSTAAAFSVYERLRRPRVSANIATSARLTAHRPAPGDPPPPTAQRPRVDEAVRADLDWTAPLA